jgi:hypothetical protein
MPLQRSNSLIINKKAMMDTYLIGNYIALYCIGIAALAIRLYLLIDADTSQNKIEDITNVLESDNTSGVTVFVREDDKGPSWEHVEQILQQPRKFMDLEKIPQESAIVGMDLTSTNERIFLDSETGLLTRVDTNGDAVIVEGNGNGLSSQEVTLLQSINSDVSETQWGYLSSLDQSLSQSGVSVKSEWSSDASFAFRSSKLDATSMCCGVAELQRLTSSK